MHAITAESILTSDGLKSGQVLLYNKAGEIQELVPIEEYKGADLERVDGLLCPGFVNAHCHLELSHLAGLIPEDTGMVGFILELQKVRGTVEPERRSQLILKAAREMWGKGTQAIGDICNGTESLAAKRENPQMHWHNFIELFGSNPNQAGEIVARGKALADTFSTELPFGAVNELSRTSLTPHAPYSISAPLKNSIYKESASQGSRLSIHLLESREEIQIFSTGDGPFLDFYQLIRQEFQGKGFADPINWLLEGFPKEASGVLWVHNTEMTAEQLNRLKKEVKVPQWFCLCPLANLYIHDRMPSQTVFADPELNDFICLGTDSLAGNYLLDILEEIKALQTYWPEIPLENILRWATLNGAKALGFDAEIGSFEAGKRPGILQLSPFDLENGKLLPETSTKRIL